MLTKRIIPCLDVKDGRVVKGVKFQGLTDAGCPEELSKNYEEQNADEVVILDVSATTEGRKTHIETIKKVRAQLSIPLTTGGGVKTAEDAGNLLAAGADKVSVNSAAVSNPELLADIAKQYGSQCCILAIDAAKKEDGSGWEVVTLSGTNRTGIDAISWAKLGEEKGAGEILLTSWDRDGTREGYDLELLKAVTESVNIPVIASGGANSAEHLLEAIEVGADAVLAASIFHYKEYTVPQLKEYLIEKGVSIRP